jgi:DNA-binding transcriptional ArsR family regulator
MQAFAILEPNRFRIVELLRSGARPVNDIAKRLKLNQPQVSKHLLVLKKARLVEVKPHAQQRFYALRAEPFRELHEWLEKYRHLWDARFEGMDKLIEEELEKKQEEKPHGRK